MLHPSVPPSHAHLAAAARQTPRPSGQTSPPCSPGGPSRHRSAQGRRRTESDWGRGSCSGATSLHPLPMILRALGGSGLISCFFCSAHRVSKWSLTPATSLWAKRKSVTSLTSRVMRSGCPHPLRFGRDWPLLHNKAHLIRMGVVGVTEHKPGVVCGQLRAGQQAPGRRYPPTRLCLPGAQAVELPLPPSFFLLHPLSTSGESHGFCLQNIS